MFSMTNSQQAQKINTLVKKCVLNTLLVRPSVLCQVITCRLLSGHLWAQENMAMLRRTGRLNKGKEIGTGAGVGVEPSTRAAE